MLSPLSKRKLTQALCISIALLLTAPTAHASTDWELIEDLDDIQVWQKDSPGTSLVTFRGKGVIQADIFSVFSVLYDADNKTNLLNRCREYRLLRYTDGETLIAYSLLESPFFLISDRDLVFKTAIVFEPDKKRILASFFKTDEVTVPPPDGVVRTAELRGTWTLEPTADGHTQVTYEAMADPSGMVPHWMVNWASKWLPHRTIQNMRQQVTRTEAYQKARLLVKYLFSFEDLLPKDHSVFQHDPKEQTLFEYELRELQALQTEASLKP